MPDGAAHGRVDVHGVAIGWSVRGLPWDPFAPLLNGFPATGRSAALEVQVAARPDLEVAAVPGRAEPAFWSGLPGGTLRAFLVDGAYEIVCPDARIVVDAHGASVAAEVRPVVGDPYAAVTTPLFVALVVALRHHGLFHLHAGAAIRPRGTRVLIAGESGCGKSTTTLALLAEGAAILGDDGVLLAEGDGSVLGWPRPIHASVAALAGHPGLRSIDGPPGSSKRWVPEVPGGLRSAMPRADLLVFPEVVAEGRTCAKRLSPDEVFGRLLRASALVAVDGAPRVRGHLARLAELVASAQGVSLTLGRDALEAPSYIPAALDALEAENNVLAP